MPKLTIGAICCGYTNYRIITELFYFRAYHRSLIPVEKTIVVLLDIGITHYLQAIATNLSTFLMFIILNKISVYFLKKVNKKYFLLGIFCLIQFSMK